MSDATETTVLDTQTISAPAVDDPAVQNALGDNSQSVDGPAKAKTPEEIAAEEAAKSEELKKAKENHDTRLYLDRILLRLLFLRRMRGLRGG